MAGTALRVAKLEIVPFTDEHLDDAGQLLASRHRRHRAYEPPLPARFEDPADARDEVAATWQTEHASGAAAFLGDKLAGYLIGAPRPDRTWGANVWVELAGHAVDEAETVRDLYALAAARWVDEGYRDHYALVPAADTLLVDAWFRLGFGHQHAHAIRELTDEAPVAPAAGIDVYRAGPDDLEEALLLDPLIADHQERSPVFAWGPPRPSADELRADWADGLADPDEADFVARADGQMVGCFVVVPVERSRTHVGLGRPDGASHLGFAATVPGVRGSGAGLALTNAVFRWAYQQGYRVMVTDWRVTNLLSSRFWPRRGFRPTFLRLFRSIPARGGS